MRESVGSPKNPADRSMEPYACMKQEMLGAAAKRDKYKKVCFSVVVLTALPTLQCVPNRMSKLAMEKDPLFDLESERALDHVFGCLVGCSSCEFQAWVT